MLVKATDDLTEAKRILESIKFPVSEDNLMKYIAKVFIHPVPECCAISLILTPYRNPNPNPYSGPNRNPNPSPSKLQEHIYKLVSDVICTNEKTIY